jgi:hypothetical protein
MKTTHAALAVAAVSASCATPLSNTRAPQDTQSLPSTETSVPEAIVAVEIDVQEINQMRCEPVTRTGTRIVIGEQCYPVGRRDVDEEALAQQLEQVRRDQEDLDRRRREAEARRGPGL